MTDTQLELDIDLGISKLVQDFLTFCNCSTVLKITGLQTDVFLMAGDPGDTSDAFCFC